MKITIKERMSVGYFLAIAALIQMPLALNTGYFSHDELQWLARADTDSLLQVPWSEWFDFSVFQYRPLTFNLWLLLSHFLGYQPILMHTAQAAFGILNALLLRQCLRHFGVTTQRASIAGLTFLIVPFVVFTHSWVGTFADMLYLTWFLIAVLWICRNAQSEKALMQNIMVPTAVAGLTTLALLSKEAAVVFPCLLLCLVYRLRVRTLLPSLLASALIVGIYLVARLNIILFAPRSPGVYTWALANLPVRLFEYSVFPFITGLHEIVAFPWWSIKIISISALGTFMVMISVASAGRRWLAALIIGWTVALGPVLILSTGATLYAYMASAFVCALLALAYPRLAPWAKGILTVACVAVIVHSVDIAIYMRRVGSMQQHLYAGLMPLLPTASESAPLLIRASNDADESVLKHLTYAIPAYHREQFSQRIQVIIIQDALTQPTQLMLHNGALIPYVKN